MIAFGPLAGTPLRAAILANFEKVWIAEDPQPPRRFGHQRNKQHALLAALLLCAQMPALMNLVVRSCVPGGQRGLGQGLLSLGRGDRQVECSRLTVGPGREVDIRGPSEIIS